MSTATTVILHEVYDDNRYNPEIDDPNSDGDIESLLTLPVQCQNLNRKFYGFSKVLYSDVE